MKSPLDIVKSFLEKRAHNKQVNENLDQLLKAFHGFRTQTGYKLPAEPVYTLDYAGEFRRVYRLDDYIIDTFQGFLGDLIIVGRTGDGATAQGLLSIDDELSILSFTYRPSIMTDQYRPMDLHKRDEELGRLASFLERATEEAVKATDDARVAIY